MYLLFDIGGTNMRLAVSNDGKELGESKTVPTPKDFTEGMRIFQEIAQELIKGEKIETIAGGVAGPLNKERTTLVAVRTNILGWNGKPLKEELGRVLGAPVHLENDAALAGLGEAVKGAGRGCGVVGYITVSTGVGGARIVDGTIDRNVLGFEPGHQIINYDAETRTLEEYISGSGFFRRFGKPSQKIIDPMLWEEAAHLLAVGLHNTILHWSPDVLVLGGPLILQSPFPFESFRKRLEESVLGVFSAVPEIKKAELGDKNGLYGALAFLQAHISF